MSILSFINIIHTAGIDHLAIMILSNSSNRIIMKDISLTVPIMIGSKVLPDGDVDASEEVPSSATEAPFAIVSIANIAGNNPLKA